MAQHRKNRASDDTVERIGQRKRLREFFLSHVGETVDSETLRQVAGPTRTTNWSRRLRELRSVDGLNVQSHNDRADLKPGQYILPDTKPLPRFDRTVSKKLRALVLDRNGYTCQSCGAAAGEPHPYDGRPTRLHIAHVRDKSMGGSDDPANLVAQCSVCNEGAADITLNRPEHDKLKALIRRAARHDQQKVLEWLVEKFPSESAALLKRQNKRTGKR